MKSHELAKKLLECPDFEVIFNASTIIPWTSGEGGLTEGVMLNNIDIVDIGYSDRVIILTGDEFE